MSDWIRQWLAEQRYTLVAPIEVTQQWELASVLRVPTAQGTLFCKAVVALPGQVDEASLLARLGQLFPRDVPQLLAAEPRQGWMLLADCGENLRVVAPPPAVLASALRRYATLQVEATGRFTELLPEQSPPALAGLVANMVADDRFTSALTPGERERLRARVGALVQAGGELARLPLPITVVHGDFHLGNVALKDGEIRFFDWSEASLSFPFFDLILFLGDAEQHGVDAAARRQLRDAYLSAWTHLAPMATLRHAVALAAPLAAFHQALLYNRIAEALLPATAARRRVAHWLRRCL